jgi:hypothetical protein
VLEKKNEREKGLEEKEISWWEYFSHKFNPLIDFLPEFDWLFTIYYLLRSQSV